MKVCSKQLHPRHFSPYDSQIAGCRLLIAPGRARKKFGECAAPNRFRHLECQVGASVILCFVNGFSFVPRHGPVHRPQRWPMPKVRDPPSECCRGGRENYNIVPAQCTRPSPVPTSRKTSFSNWCWDVVFRDGNTNNEIRFVCRFQLPSGALG